MNLNQEEMVFSGKLPFTSNKVTVRGYASQTRDAMRMIHNNFVTMAGKLKTALHEKRITDKEYNDWMHCFHSLQEEWLGREVNTPEDVLFLQWIAKSVLEEAQRFGNF